MNKNVTLQTFTFPYSQNIEFSMNKDNSGRVLSLSLVGIEEKAAEAYCLSFVTAILLDKGDITFKSGKIVFYHGGVDLKEQDPGLNSWGVSRGGIFSTDISDQDAEELSQFLELKGPYQYSEICFRIEFEWGRGFTLYPKSKIMVN